VLKSHASARDRDVASAIRATSVNLQHQVNQLIAEAIARANDVLQAAPAPMPQALSGS
jgi:hypothetical protein